MSNRRAPLVAILLSTMAASSFQSFALSVLAVDIIDDLGLSRTALGLLGSLSLGIGALTSPTIGRITDRVGASRSIVVLLGLSGLGMAVMALSTTAVVLAASSVISGIPMGWGNPATNALIAERIPAGAQGTVTGIKQSGVQLGIFIAGLTLPGLALLLGWRGAMWGFAGLFALGAVTARRALGRGLTTAESGTTGSEGVTRPTPLRGPGPATTSDGNAPVPAYIWLIALYALSAGTAGGAIGRFFPLWAHEEVGLTTVVAGVLVGISGLIGIGARIVAGRAAERLIDPPRLLSLLALVGAVYCLTLLVTTSVGSWILWPGTALNAVGTSAWNAVAMLTVIMAVPRHAAGRASGIVMLGFLGGLAIGSPIAGWMIDRWNTYQPVWLLALVLMLFSALVTSAGRARVVTALKPA